MKKAMLLAPLMLAGCAPENPAQAQAEAVERGKVCADAEEIARLIMTQRQDNIPMNALLKIVMDNEPDPAIRENLREAVIQAYERPAYLTREHQQREINDFGNEWAIKCWRS